jgi:hypothetical protein
MFGFFLRVASPGSKGCAAQSSALQNTEPDLPQLRRTEM